MGAISDSNKKPNLKTFQGLSLFLAGNESTNIKSIQDTANKSNSEQVVKQENPVQESRENTSKINTDVSVTNEQTASTEDNNQQTSNTNKQTFKSNLDTFSGLSLFFTATPNNSSSDTSAQNINTANRDQANAVGKTLAPSITTTPMSDEQTAVNKAAASLQTAITQGTAYINSAAFSKMTAEKQAQLRAAMQTGKELISKYNAMQIAVNSAALDVDQNNKNKAPTNISTNLMALNAVTSNIITTANTNSTNAVITTSELAQAAHNIMLRLGSVNSNISYDAGTQTVTISAGEIDNNWLKDPSLLPDNAQVKHIKITGRVTVADGNASNLFSPYYREPMTTLQDITGLSNLDTSNITNMSGMFSFLRLTSLDVSNFDTSNVTNMSQMFENDDNLTSLDVSHFNTGKVTKMVYMFGGDSSLTSLDLSNFDTSKVTDMSNMFSGDSSLTSLDVSNLDTKNVTNMSDMFYEDSSLTSLDVSNFDTSNVTNMNEMFASVSDLTSLDVSNFDTSNVTNMGNMFGNDTALTNIIGLHNFDTSKVTDMNLMFNDDSALTSLDLSSFDTSQVTDMGDMFYGDYNLINLTGLESFNTSQVTNMSNMFDGDSGLTSLDLSSFDTSQVTDMGDMLAYDSGLTSLDISNFDTSNVSNMSNMLNASNLNKLTLGEKTKLASGAGIPGTTWYKDGDLSRSATVADLENGKAHAGTWELANASVTLKFVNAKHTDKTLYTSDVIPGFTGKSLDLTDSTVKSTYITPNIPTGYTYATTDAELAGQTQPTKADFTATGNTVTIYLAGDPETNVTVKYELKNGNQVGNTITPTGNQVGDTIDLSQDGAVIQANPIPDGYHYATNPDDMPANYVQPGPITYSTQSQDKVIYVVGDPVAAGDTVKVVHYLEGTTKPVPGLTDYVLGTGGHYGDVVTASGDDAAQKAPFGYKLVNPDAQTYVLTKNTNPQKTFVFYYTKNGGGSLPEPDRTPKLPIPGEVDIPQGTDLSNDTTYAGDAITNKDQMPDGTKYSWQPAPDTSKQGKQAGTVVVTYPDGTKTSINVMVNIVDKNVNGNTGNNSHDTAKEEVLKHNAYLYGQDGRRANQAVLKAGSTVTTYGMVVINGRKFFTLDNDYYLATGNAVSQTRKLKHNAYLYNKYGQRVGKKVVKTGQNVATYGTVVTIRGKKYYTIDHNHFMKANNFMKIAYPDLANSELSPNAKQDSDKAFTVKALQHNAYLYNKEGKRANKVILNLNSKVKTYGMKTINGRKFYVAANNYYIAAGNIDATKRKLTHNAYIYSQYGNRIGRKVVKQHQVVGTYGDPVGIRGKSYYIIGSGRYLKQANFETTR